MNMNTADKKGENASCLWHFCEWSNSRDLATSTSLSAPGGWKNT